MVVRICSICGKKITDPRGPLKPEVQKRLLEGMEDGRYMVNYSQAVTDENGDVIRFTYADDFTLCPECMRVADKAVKNAFEPILKNRKKSLSVSLDKFPPDPVPDYYPIPSPF